MRRFCASGIAALALLAPAGSRAELRVHPIFDSNMVIQRDRPIRVWGRAGAGDVVTVEFAGQTKKATAEPGGAWAATLDPLPACDRPQTLTVRGGGRTVRFGNVLIGDVWVLGGQSNMEDVLEGIYHGDVEVASARHEKIRLLTIPQRASPTPLADFPRIDEYNAWSHRTEKKGWWFPCSPETVRRFSAIGYIFGRRLYLATGVPIGLIDTSWGGTTVEAWVSRRTLEGIDEAKGLLAEWDARIAAYDPDRSLRELVARWEKDTERRKKEGKPPAPKPTEPRPSPAVDRNNPGASFNGMISVFAGFAVRGAVFNQGYNNALGNARPRLYARTFQAMIRDWREAFDDPNMPFGIVELTAGGRAQTLANFEQMMVDPAPFIREGQYRAWREMKHVGYACAYDQQVPWYHPHRKLMLGERIARWALATQYGLKIGYAPAVCVSAEPRGGRIVLTFDRPVRGRAGRPIEGFAVAGEDRRWYPAEAKYVVVGKDDRGRDREDRTRLEVFSELVPRPVAVRYAWARNPLGNLVNDAHFERILPVPSFRTDRWDWPEAPFAPRGSEAENAHRRKIYEMRRSAEQWVRQRPIEQARALLEKAAEVEN